MKKEDILKTVEKIRKDSKKRNFVQSFDLIINLKELNLKKENERVDSFFSLPKSFKELKICAFLDKRLGKFDKEIVVDEFGKYKEKDVRKLANEFDYFVADGKIMGKVAGAFGKVLSQKGKMPNPKAGAVITADVAVDVLKEKLRRLVRLQTKNELSVKCGVGLENMDDKDIVDNTYAVYDYLIHMLPKEKQNIKKVYLKLTMGSCFEVGDGKKDS